MTPNTHHRALIAALSASVLCLGSCGKPVEEEVESETVVSVKTEAASLGTIRGLVHATGVVHPAPGAELVVVAPEAARIAEVPKGAGDPVRRGEVLVRFEIPQSLAEVERQQAEIARAQATLTNAKAAQTRAADLFERGVAARKEVEETTRASADAEAALAQARASLTAAETVAGRATVRATFNGIVARRQHNPGDLVEPTATDEVLRVIDPARLEVVASVPISDASRITVGAAAHLASAQADGPQSGLRVLSRPVSVDAGTATIPVRLGFSPATKLADGTPVQVEIEAELHRNVVLVPTVAVVREGDETAVFVAAGGKAERRPVELGLNDGAHVEIVSGLKAGEAVIVDGQAGLPDGAAIKVSNETTAADKPESDKAPEKDGAK